MNTIISMLLFTLKMFGETKVFFPNNHKVKFLCENVRNKSIRSHKTSEVRNRIIV